MTVVTETQMEYKVADIKLADFGRKEIEIAEKEMPRFDVTSREVWRSKTIERCTYHGIVAHDHSNCCFNRNLG